MTWNPMLPSLPTGHLSQVKPQETLYEFDGPILFTASVGLSNMLFSKVDETELGDLFLVVPTSEKVVDALRKGSLSVRGALGSESCFIADIDSSGKINSYWQAQIDQLDEELLPERGVGLDPSVDWVVDSVEQLDSFFSIRFSGDGLARDTIPFRTFMKLMGNVYDAARDTLAPSQLAKARSTVFDFNIREPVFGSLIVAIDKPQSNSHKVNKYLKRSDLTDAKIALGFEKSRDSLFDGLVNLVETDPAELDIHQSASRHDLIAKLVELLPDEDTSFSKIEFNSSSATGVRHVEIEREQAAKLREEHKQASLVIKEFSGVITIINDKSATFVVQADFGREVTCYLSRDLFEQLQQDIRFVTKAAVKLHGEYTVRPRRDELSVQSVPLIVNRN